MSAQDSPEVLPTLLEQYGPTVPLVQALGHEAVDQFLAQMNPLLTEIQARTPEADEKLARFLDSWTATAVLTEHMGGFDEFREFVSNFTREDGILASDLHDRALTPFDTRKNETNPEVQKLLEEYTDYVPVEVFKQIVALKNPRLPNRICNALQRAYGSNEGYPFLFSIKEPGHGNSSAFTPSIWVFNVPRLINALPTIDRGGNGVGQFSVRLLQQFVEDWENTKTSTDPAVHSYYVDQETFAEISDSVSGTEEPVDGVVLGRMYNTLTKQRKERK